LTLALAAIHPIMRYWLKVVQQQAVEWQMKEMGVFLRAAN